MEGAHDLSLLGLVRQADPLVKAVLAVLVLASVASWAIILEKALALARLGREVAELRRALPGDGGRAGAGLVAAVLGAGLAEWREGREAVETRGEFRARLEQAMDEAFAPFLHRVEPGLPFLASVGAVAPFVGLFGTVWGIMNSFSAIAAASDTSLSVVAPGIAEALFVTAVGLAAAIPAVLGYNRLGVRLGRLRRQGQGAIAALAGRMARAAPGAGG
jgi:biopolymer transport protein ExbB/TolQ